MRPAAGARVPGMTVRVAAGLARCAATRTMTIPEVTGAGRSPAGPRTGRPAPPVAGPPAPRGAGVDRAGAAAPGAPPGRVEAPGGRSEAGDAAGHGDAAGFDRRTAARSTGPLGGRGAPGEGPGPGMAAGPGTRPRHDRGAVPGQVGHDPLGGDSLGGDS